MPATSPGDEMASRPRRPWPSLRDRWDVLLVISLGGALGSLARWGIGELVPWAGDGFPWATFAANVSGAFALGVLMVLLLDLWPPSRYVRPFLGVGLLGGYTTFSAYMLETRDLLASGHTALATAYLLGTLGVGLLAVWLGVAAVRTALRWAQRRRRRSWTGNGPPHREADRSTNRSVDETRSTP